MTQPLLPVQPMCRAIGLIHVMRSRENGGTNLCSATALPALSRELDWYTRNVVSVNAAGTSR